MSFKVKCPECPTLIYQNATQCKCGWKNKDLSRPIPEVMIRCAHLDCEKRGLKDVNRVNDKEYLCEHHWEEWVLKNQHDKHWSIQAQQILLTRKFIQEAKDLEISNIEYFEKNASAWGGLKERLLSKANLSATGVAESEEVRC